MEIRKLDHTESIQGALQEAKQEKIAPYFLAFFLFLDSMNGNQADTITDAKNVDAYNSLQDSIHAQLTALVWTKLPKNAGEATIHRVVDENKQITAQQTNLQQGLIYLGMGTQKELVKMRSSTDIATTLGKQASSVLSAVDTCFALCQKLSPANIA